MSCSEIDQLVDIALGIPGVYGSRITGGGSGGCTVTLLKSEAIEIVVAAIKEKYDNLEEGKKASIFICSASPGARVVMDN